MGNKHEHSESKKDNINTGEGEKEREDAPSLGELKSRSKTSGRKSKQSERALSMVQHTEPG